MKIVSIFLLFSITLAVHSQNAADRVNPIAIMTMENGVALESDSTFRPGDVIEGAAPLHVEFKSRINVPEGVTWRCEWQFAQSEDFSTLAFPPRPDEDTDFTFNAAGGHYVRLLVTFSDIGEVDAGYFAIRIYESYLKIPNAFSPNGDGINDVFKVSHQSLIRFEATIFNRWGQQVYHWNLNNIDDGWDGTHKGRQVKDGVYFIVVEAEGADGRKFRHKGDINILRGFSGDGTSTGTPD